VRLLRALVVTGVVLAGVAVLVLGGSGALDGLSVPDWPRLSTGPASSTPSVTTSTQPDPQAEHAPADVLFLQAMIARQEQTAKLTESVQDSALDREAAALVAAISSTEDDERAEMTGWLRAWGEPLTPTGGIGPQAERGGVRRLSDADLAAVQEVGPQRYQGSYLNLLIAQQDNAALIARTVRENGRNEEVLDLAARIEESRRAEVQLMLDLAAAG